MILRFAGLAGALALAACSPPADEAVTAPSADEQKALAEAREMIPASEMPAETTTPPATESAAQ